jgi:hypothetical protein
MSKANVSYEAITGTGIGFDSNSIVLDHAQMTDVTTTGTFVWTEAIPDNALRYACMVETLETYNAATTVAVGIADAGQTWTSAGTGTCTTLGYKNLFPYGAATIVTGAASGTAGGESIHVTLTTADYTAITSGKIRVTVYYLATEV